MSWRRLALLLLASILAGLALQPVFVAHVGESAAAQEQPIFVSVLPAVLDPVERPVEDELILEMRLGRFVLSEAFLGYTHPGGILLPLGEVTAALEFPIFVDLDSGRAEGWFLREDRRFVLDLVDREVLVEGRREALPTDLVELHFDDIYVDSALIEAWFPVELDIDLLQLVVDVTSREPLPLEERLAREQAQALLRPGAEQPKLPRLDLPHRAIDVPFVDTSLSYDFDNESGQRATYSTLISGDFLFLDTKLFATGDDEEALSDVRLTMGRKDPDKALLGPVGASEFAIGDVFTPQLPLVASQQEGRGVSVSTFPINRPSEFDRTTLRGELPLGWEVQLFRNDALLDFRSSRDDGRYEFLDVPLLFGNNVLRLEFFGPQGQRRTEVSRFRIGPGLVTPGQQSVRVAVNQQGEDTIPVGDDDAGSDAADGEIRFLGEYERGLTRTLSAAAGVAHIPLDDGHHTYASLGVRAALLGAFLRFDAAQDLNGGTALRGSAQTEILGLNVLAEHEEFFDFVGERDGNTSSDDLLSSRSALRLDGQIFDTVLPRMSYSIDGTLERRESGRFDLDVRNRLSTGIANVSASNTLNFRSSGGAGTTTTSNADGSLLLSGRVGRISLRGRIDYNLDPESDFTSISVSAERRFDDDLVARLDVDRQLTQDQITTVSPSISKDFGRLALGLFGSVSDDNEYSAGLTVSFGIGREPRSGSFAMRSRGIANNGAASARVFLDENQNGLFDPDNDQPLPSVRFVRQRDLDTNDEGVAFITGLPSYQPINISVDVDSLEDPFMVPTHEGVEIVPRPGKTAVIDFPVVLTGEVDGMVFLRRGGEVREVSNVQLELVDADGMVVKQTKSEIDGFYLFDFVRPGRYDVRIAPDQVERLKLRVPPAQEVLIASDGTVVSGIDFVLERVAHLDPDTLPNQVPLPGSDETQTDHREAKVLETKEHIVQLAAYRSSERAQVGWSDLNDAHSGLLAGLAPIIQREDLGESGIFYRLRAGPLPDKASAGALCEALERSGTGCFVVER